MTILHGLLSPRPCRADEPTASPPECREAFEEADLELRPGPEPHLLRARELLRRCASPTCQPWMIAACMHSLTEVERRIPTVVITARAAGRPIIEAGVQEQGRWLTHRLDGRSVEIEPGEHDLDLKLPSGEEVRMRFVVEEGARLQRLDFLVPQAADPAPEANTGTRSEASYAPRWLRTAGVVAAAGGVGFLALGTVSWLGMRGTARIVTLAAYAIRIPSVAPTRRPRSRPLGSRSAGRSSGWGLPRSASRSGPSGLLRPRTRGRERPARLSARVHTQRDRRDCRRRAGSGSRSRGSPRCAH